MSRVRDIANILSGGSSAIATDSEIPSYVAGKNFVINGGMDIWQRGTSFTTDSGATVLYTADRISAWTLYPGNGSTQTITRETSSSHIPPNFKYSLKSVVSNAIPVNSGRMVLGYTMENQDALFLAGKTITYSMQVKAIGNIDRVYLYSRYNTTGGNSHNNGTDAANAFFTINSSSFTTITWTTTVPSATTITSSGTYGLQFVYYRSNNAVEAIGDGIYVTGIQAEIGSVATPFSRAGGNIQGELAACQRYYEKSYIDSVSPGSNLNPASNGMIEQQALILSSPVGSTPGSSRSRSFPQSFKVQKRVTPSFRIWDLAGNINKYTSGDANGSFSANNNSLDIYGGAQVTQNSITWQTGLASSSHIYAGIMWEVSAEL
jgi:hypothetical protein